MGEKINVDFFAYDPEHLDTYKEFINKINKDIVNINSSFYHIYVGYNKKLHFVYNLNNVALTSDYSQLCNSLEEPIITSKKGVAFLHTTLRAELMKYYSNIILKNTKKKFYVWGLMVLKPGVKEEEIQKLNFQYQPTNLFFINLLPESLDELVSLNKGIIPERLIYKEHRK